LHRPELGAGDGNSGLHDLAIEFEPIILGDERNADRVKQLDIGRFPGRALNLRPTRQYLRSSICDSHHRSHAAIIGRASRQKRHMHEKFR
jgi:hypothetical protein